MFEKIKNRVVLILKEIFNILTNLLIPLLGLIILIVEFLPLPGIITKVLKTIEYWLFYFSGTAKNIEEGIQEKYKK